MPDFKATSRYQIINPSDPSRWRDLTAAADEAELTVRHVGERTKVFRVLVPKGRHDFGTEYPLFTRARSDMDSSWNHGKLPSAEVGIVHRIGVGVSHMVCNQNTSPDDVIRVLSNAYLEVSVNDGPIVEGSLETLPTGFGLHNLALVTNGIPAADAVPDRVPFLFTNAAMEFTGKLSFPHRTWLRDAMTASAAALDTETTSEDTDTERDCDDPSHDRPNNHCVTLGSDVLVTFYMTGVFGRVDEPNG